MVGNRNGPPSYGYYHLLAVLWYGWTCIACVVHRSVIISVPVDIFMMARVHPGLQMILLKRFAYIALWHVCIQTLFLQFIASVDFSERTVLWLPMWLRNFAKPRFFAVVLFQSLVTLIFILTESIQYLKVIPGDKMTRIRYFSYKFGPNNLIWSLVYLLRGILMVIVFFIAFQDYFVYPADESNTVKHDHITETIIILFNDSIFINLLFFLYDFIYRKSFKHFSLIQHNYALTMPSILITTKIVSVKSVNYCVRYILFYLVGGVFFCSYSCRVLREPAIFSFSTIFNPFGLYCMWLLNAYFLFNIFVLELLYDMYLISHVKFPIYTDLLSQRNEVVLKNALATYNVPLLQYLGYYDLYIASQFDKNRRKEIFALSYPGGHPNAWKEVSHEAIKIVFDTAKELENLISPKPPLVNKNCIEETLYLSNRRHYRDIRPLSPSPNRSMNEKDAVGRFFDGFLENVRSIRFVAYLTEVIPEKQLEAIMQRYQSLSLACFSLANLAEVSINEDTYGVMQQDLTAIIHALLKLYVTLNKLVIVDKKTNASMIQVKKNLISVVKSCLYKISLKFGSHVKDLNLPPEDQKVFEGFIFFRI